MLNIELYNLLEKVFKRYQLLNENEKFSIIKHIYDNLSIYNEFNECLEFKITLLQTLKSILEDYEFKQIALDRTHNNYISGYKRNNIKDLSFLKNYNFLKLDIADFQISKYDIFHDIEDNIKVIAKKHNFNPIVTVATNSIDEFDEVEKEIIVTRNQFLEYNLQLNITKKRYIYSILDTYEKKSYVMSNIKFNDPKELNFNNLSSIIYYEIISKDANPLKSILIKRSQSYPEHVEVLIDNEYKFVTKINVNNGINSLENFEKPIEKTICTKDENAYIKYVFATHKIDSEGINLSNRIQNQKQKTNFIKYVKREK